MDIHVGASKSKGFTPSIGEMTLELKARMSAKIGEKGADVIQSEAISILSNCCDPKSDNPQSITNLAFGYVQSGKTMSFTMLSALAHDNGFRIIIYFAGTKNNLLEQTTKRLRKDLINEGKNSRFYKLFENPSTDDINKIKNSINLSSSPTILITVLKQHKHIGDLEKIFTDLSLKSVLKNQGVLIIDDEADQASLNSYANANSKRHESGEWDDDDEFSTTYRKIRDLKNALPNHSYLQYTATPQGPLLISMMDILSPKNHTVLTPGEGYTGGMVFFKENPGLIIDIPQDEVYHASRNPLTSCPKSLLDALKLFFIEVAIVVESKNKEQYLSMMIHADRTQDANVTFKTWVTDIINGWTTILTECDEDDFARNELLDQFELVYPEAIRQFELHGEEYPPFEEVATLLPDVICGTDIQLIISNAKHDDEIDWYGSTSHILIGAEMLNRGFTVENLAVTYMPRYSIGKSQADTIQQRCRFFGYKRNYLWACRVYLPQSSSEEYREYVDHEEEMRQWLKKSGSLDEVKRMVLLSPNLNATRKNILPCDIVSKRLTGWHSMRAFNQSIIDANTIHVNDFITKYSGEFKDYNDYGTDDRNHRYLKLPINDIIEFISGFEFNELSDKARKEATIRYLSYLASKEEGGLTHSYILQMAYNGDARERSYNPDKNTVSNLFVGESPSGKDIYPGDRECKWSDGITIQLHHIRLKTKNKFSPYYDVEAYTLAFHYPEDYAINYISSNTDE